MRLDVRLGIYTEIARQIEAGGLSLTPGDAFLTAAYHVPLTADVGKDEVFVRAATGEEVTDLLTTGSDGDGDDLDWPGDPAQPLKGDLYWSELPGSPTQCEPAVKLWSGEVIFKSGKGIAGPFFIHEMAAAAWAFSHALDQPPGDVFECQVVPYACVRRFAPGLIRKGDAEARRLGRFDISPLRPLGQPETIPLPGAEPAL